MLPKICTRFGSCNGEDSCQGDGRGLLLRSLELLFLPDPGIKSLLTSQRQTRAAGTNCFGRLWCPELQKPPGMQVLPPRDLQGTWAPGQGTEHRRGHMGPEKSQRQEKGSQLKPSGLWSPFYRGDWGSGYRRGMRETHRRCRHPDI